MDGGPPGPQGQGCQKGGDVGEADHPGGLSGCDGVPVQVRDQVDAGLATPRWNDCLDLGIEQHCLELGGALGDGCANVPIAVHALPDPSLQTVLVDRLQSGVDARLQHAGRTG